MASYNCVGSIALTLSHTPAAGMLLGLGTHTITVTATDPSGNSASCTTTFTVTDNTAPTVICSAVAGASADGNCQAAVPNVMSGVSVSDACSAASAITLSQSPAAGTLVGLGTHTITVSATDAAGNSATCATTFTVTDNKAPTVICSATQPASADGKCQAPVPNVMGGTSVSDNCSAPSALTLSQSPAPGTLVGLGTHTITVTATDAAGNSASCTTTFTVETSISANAPSDLEICQGQDANFVIVASGVGPFEYQWRLNGNGVGTNGPSLTVPTSSLSVGDHAVEVAVHGACGPTVTNVATLTVQLATAADGPVDLRRDPGQSANFGSSASGAEPMAYQWRKRSEERRV